MVEGRKIQRNRRNKKRRKSLKLNFAANPRSGEEIEKANNERYNFSCSVFAPMTHNHQVPLVYVRTGIVTCQLPII